MASEESTSRVESLGETFAEVARTLRGERSVQATLDKIVELAVKTIDGCEHAGVTLVERGKMRTPAASDEIPRLVDAVQYETGEGPCLDAIRDHDVFQTDDLTQEPRWPNFSRRAAEESGVASMLAYRLYIEEDTMGSLNLYSMQEAAFDAEDRAVGSIFAAHAAVALSAANQQDNLEQAIETRDVIGQAKGILMARQHVSADEAFEMLRRASQRLNIKLRVLAKQVATEPNSPGSPPPST
ncbi:MAG: GAF and ANTAR domain-containing protein [Actinomycetota bacterium]|nr:GAF and ANTAR domain-containing protein [Actinomycetota bacterium]